MKVIRVTISSSYNQKLSPLEKEAIRVCYLGGVEAMRDRKLGINVAPATVKSLLSKGIMDGHGLTEAGKMQGKLLSELLYEHGSS